MSEHTQGNEASIPPTRIRRRSSDVTPMRRYSEAERNHILDTALDSRLPRVIIYTGGRVYGGPQVRRSTTSAEILYTTPMTHPGMIVVDCFLTTLTCGLYLPVWIYRTYRKPNVYTLSIDEYGNQDYSQKDVSHGQRVLRYVLLVPIVAFLAFMAVGVILYLAGWDPPANPS
jgi:hypothetical protein